VRGMTVERAWNDIEAAAPDLLSRAKGSPLPRTGEGGASAPGEGIPRVRELQRPHAAKRRPRGMQSASRRTWRGVRT
jgi:hypothetical protein